MYRAIVAIVDSNTGAATQKKKRTARAETFLTRDARARMEMRSRVFTRELLCRYRYDMKDVTFSSTHRSQ